MDSFGLVCDEVNVGLVRCSELVKKNKTQRSGLRRYTFEQSFDLVEFVGVVQLPKVFCLLGKVFPLNQRISLVCH